MEASATDAASEGGVLDFGDFFRDEYRRLFHALVLICGDREEADDVAQEAFVKVLQRWDRVGRMEAPRAYLYRVALNEHRSRARRAFRWARRTLFVRGPGDVTSEAAIARAELDRALQALSPQQRDAIVLAEYVGMDAPEAGAVLGIDAAAIRARLHRARTTLRRELSEDA